MSLVTTLPRRPLTVDDLDAMPDDGHRYEIIDETLIVSAGPELRSPDGAVGTAQASLRLLPRRSVRAGRPDPTSYSPMTRWCSPMRSSMRPGSFDD
jgi:hypothetical protein